MRQPLTSAFHHIPYLFAILMMFSHRPLITSPYVTATHPPNSFQMHHLDSFYLQNYLTKGIIEMSGYIDEKSKIMQIFIDLRHFYKNLNSKNASQKLCCFTGSALFYTIRSPYHLRSPEATVSVLRYRLLLQNLHLTCWMPRALLLNRYFNGNCSKEIANLVQLPAIRRSRSIGMSYSFLSPSTFYQQMLLLLLKLTTNSCSLNFSINKPQTEQDQNKKFYTSSNTIIIFKL